MNLKMKVDELHQNERESNMMIKNHLYDVIIYGDDIYITTEMVAGAVLAHRDSYRTLVRLI